MIRMLIFCAAITLVQGVAAQSQPPAPANNAAPACTAGCLSLFYSAKDRAAAITATAVHADIDRLDANSKDKAFGDLARAFGALPREVAADLKHTVTESTRQQEAILRRLTEQAVAAQRLQLTQQIVAAGALKTALGDAFHRAGVDVAKVKSQDINAFLASHREALVREAREHVAAVLSTSALDKSIESAIASGASDVAFLGEMIDTVGKNPAELAKLDVSKAVTLLNRTPLGETAAQYQSVADSWTTLQSNVLTDLRKDPPKSWDDVGDQANKLSGDFAAAATVLNAVGLKDAGEAFSKGSQALQMTQQIATAMASGNYIGAALGVIGVAGLGGGDAGGPSMDTAAILSAIADLKADMKKYHEEEMAKLNEVLTGVVTLQDTVDLGFSNVLRYESAIYTNQLTFGMMEFDRCVITFANLWDTLKRSKTASDFSQMATTLAQPAPNCVLSVMPEHFRPFETVLPNPTFALWDKKLPDPLGIGVVNATRMLAHYTDDAKLASAETEIPRLTVADVRRIGTMSRIELSTIASIEGDQIAHNKKMFAPYGLTDRGIVDPAALFDAARYAIDAASWRQIITDQGKVADNIESMNLKSAGNDARILLESVQQLVRFTLAQQQLLHGLVAVKPMAKEVENLLPVFANARYSGDVSALCNLLSVPGDAPCPGENRVPTVVPAQLSDAKKRKQDCNVANQPTYNTLCAMQSDPVLARAVIQYLVTDLVSPNGFSRKADIEFRLKRQFLDDPSTLFNADAILIKDAPTPLASADWALYLPRVNVKKLNISASERTPSLPTGEDDAIIASDWINLTARNAVTRHPLPVSIDESTVPVTTPVTYALMQCDAEIGDALAALDKIGESNPTQRLIGEMAVVRTASVDKQYAVPRAASPNSTKCGFATLPAPDRGASPPRQ